MTAAQLIIADTLQLSPDQHEQTRGAVAQLADALEATARHYCGCAEFAAHQLGEDPAAHIPQAVAALSPAGLHAQAVAAVAVYFRGLPEDRARHFCRFACVVYPAVLAEVSAEYVAALGVQA